jgi:serine/threonine-protein kinase
LIQTSNIEQNGEISPDSRWLVYESNNSGQFEIYVRPFPNVDSGLWQVSTGGGTRPLWAQNGQELFYRSPTGAVMSVRIELGATWTGSTPSKLFEGRYFVGGGNFARTYDVAPDGRRFLMIKLGGGGSDETAAPPSLIVVQHWFEELKRLVKQ